MGKPRLEKLESTHFRCGCGHEFESAPDRVLDEPSWWWHPYRYFAECGACGEEAPQDSRYRGLLKAHAFATGPTTEAGKAMSAANLNGHPTPEEAQKTRFNAITHGLTARVATNYPAKPGKYARCATCVYLNHECIPDAPAYHKNPPACLARVELHMKHQIAFDSGDPGLLLTLRAETQANIQAIMDDILLDIAQRGVALVAPAWKINPKTGDVVLGRYLDETTGEFKTIYDVSANPLIKPLLELISKNNLSLEDMGMTPKVTREQEMMQGFLDDEKENRESAGNYRDRIEQQQDMLLKLIRNSYRDGDVIEAEIIEHG